jgi:hypothetical protein
MSLGRYSREELVEMTKDRLRICSPEQVINELIKLGANTRDASHIVHDSQQVSSRTWDFVLGEMSRLVEWHERRAMPYRSTDETTRDSKSIAQRILIEYAKDNTMKLGTWVRGAGFDNPYVITKIGQVVTNLIMVRDRERNIAEKLALDYEAEHVPQPASPITKAVSVQWYGRQPGADGLSEICIGFHDPATLAEISDEELETQIGIEAARRERRLRAEPEAEPEMEGVS